MNPIVDHIMTAFQLFINFATIITLLYTLLKFTQKPADNMRSRLESLEKWQVEVERRLTRGDEHFTAMDEGNAVTQQALLALMDANISGNNVEELKKARAELYEYITSRRKHD